jgi:Mn-dependent DtxR family transcriptional regulator
MDNTVWKCFEENILTHSAAHYLMTIKELLNRQGYARITDIAERLNITRGSCSISIKALKNRGWVLEDKNRFLHLSKEGHRLAALVERNDELLETFFRDILGISPEQAKIDACKVEHLLSMETTMKLAGFIKYTASDSSIAKEFLAELHECDVHCMHDSKNCNLCHNICFLRQDHEPEGEQEIRTIS